MQPKFKQIASEFPRKWEELVNQFLTEKEIVIDTKSITVFSRDMDFVFTCIYFDKTEYINYIKAMEKQAAHQYALQDNEQVQEEENSKQLKIEYPSGKAPKQKVALEEN